MQAQPVFMKQQTIQLLSACWLPGFVSGSGDTSNLRPNSPVPYFLLDSDIYACTSTGGCEDKRISAHSLVGQVLCHALGCPYPLIPVVLRAARGDLVGVQRLNRSRCRFKFLNHYPFHLPYQFALNKCIAVKFCIS